jgi:hypothetical protein
MPTQSFFDAAEAADVERDLAEEDDEAFDRMAFAAAALDLVNPKRTRVALCEGHTRVRVESGRAWGRSPGERWAVLSVPRRASRRAIALAVVQLASGQPIPWAFDLLLGDRRGHAYR